MIYKKCVMTIDKNKATLDEDIYLYRLDKNIELYFTIVNNKYRFNKGDMNNIILITNASFFQVRLYKNAEIEYTFAIQPTDGGQAILTITDDLIDDPIEVGDYDFQISLLDEEKTSMISMPIVSKQLHVCEPLVSDDATMGKAILGLSKLATGEIKNAFDSEGNYIREIHKDGDILSASIINKFEEALDTNTKAIKNGTGTSYDDTEIKTDINTIKTDLGTEELTTTAKTVKGSINEVAAQYKDLAKKTMTTDERNKLTNLENYDDTSVKNDIQTQKARIDTFTSLKEGSTTGDAELIDGRVGDDGVVYSNIGDSIRTQIKNINNALYGGISSKNSINLWEQGTFHSSELGKIDSNLFIRTKDPISKDFDDVSLNANTINVSFAVINSDKTVKKWLKYEGEEVYFSSTFKNICLFSKDTLESHKKKLLDILLSQDYPYVYICLSNTDNSNINVESYNNLNISKNATGLTEVFQNVSNGKKLIASAITDKGINTSNTDTFQTMANNINKIESDDKLLYKFGVVSDNHCAEAYHGQSKMIKVLNYYNNSDVDFVCSCGDITTDDIAHIDWLKSEMSTLNFSKPFYAVRGNHDVYLTNEQWKSYFGHEPNFSFNKGNDMFIFLSIDYNCNPPYNYNDAWPYLQTLDVTNKRVFLIQHLSWEGKAGMRNGEVYGFTKDHEIGNNIYNYFPKNLIAFTGHSHYTFECEEQLPKYDINVYNENRLSKTVIHCPSTGYAVDKDRNKILDKDIIEGWICEVYNKKIILKAIDFNMNEYIPNYTYIVNTL